MSLEPILESTECWCRSNVSGQTVPHRKFIDFYGERQNFDDNSTEFQQFYSSAIG